VAPVVILLGPTGAGKSQQAKALAKRFNLVRVSSGDLLRATGDAATLEAMARGDLADTQFVENLVGEALGVVEEDRGVVMDGFPRNMEEVEWLDANLETLGFEIRKVIFIDISKQTSLDRLRGRGRTDDELHIIEQRWDMFGNYTAQVIGLYEGRRQLVRVDGSKSPEEVTKEIAHILL
jgi:adenylate kinase